MIVKISPFDFPAFPNGDPKSIFETSMQLWKISPYTQNVFLYSSYCYDNIKKLYTSFRDILLTKTKNKEMSVAIMVKLTNNHPIVKSFSSKCERI